MASGGRFLVAGQPKSVSSYFFCKLLYPPLVITCWLWVTSFRLPSTCTQDTRALSSGNWVVNTTGQSLHWLVTGGRSRMQQQWTSMEKHAQPKTNNNKKNLFIPFVNSLSVVRSDLMKRNSFVHLYELHDLLRLVACSRFCLVGNSFKDFPLHIFLISPACILLACVTAWGFGMGKILGLLKDFREVELLIRTALKLTIP